LPKIRRKFARSGHPDHNLWTRVLCESTKRFKNCLILPQLRAQGTYLGTKCCVCTAEPRFEPPTSIEAFEHWSSFLALCPQPFNFIESYEGRHFWATNLYPGGIRPYDRYNLHRWKWREFDHGSLVLYQDFYVFDHISLMQC
jgi:hypothetical protein